MNTLSKNKSISNNNFVTGLLLLTVFLILSGIAVHFIFSIIALVICLLVILFSTDKKTLYIIAFLYPFSLVFKISPDMISFFSILLIFSTMKLLLSKHTYFDIQQLLLLTILFTIVIVSGIQNNLIGFLNISSNLIFLYLVVNSKELEIDAIFIKFLTFGFLLASIIALFSSFIPDLDQFLTFAQIGEGGIYVDRFSGLSSNPNYFSFDLLLIVTANLIAFLTKKMNAIYLFLSIVLIIFGTLTLSKQYIVGLALMLSLLIIWSMFINTKKTITMIALILMLLLTFHLILPDTSAIIFSRFNIEEGINSLTSGRLVIYSKYINAILEDVHVFSVGRGIDANLVDSIASHNFILELLYHIGLFGTLFYGLVIYNMVIKNRTGIKRGFLKYIIIIVFLFRILAINMLFYDGLVILYIVLWTVLNLGANSSGKGIYDKK